LLLILNQANSFLRLLQLLLDVLQVDDFVVQAVDLAKLANHFLRLVGHLDALNLNENLLLCYLQLF